jgi:hypothetical protein
MDLVVFGDAMKQLRGWTTLLIAFDVIYWAVCGILFRYAVEEGE